MIERPWVTPEEVIAYTDHKEIKERSTSKIAMDITRAEAKIISICHNKFTDDKYEEVPDELKLAVILTAEAYAKNSIERTKKQYTSETFDDYSYTVKSSDIDLSELDLPELLKEFILPEDTGNITMRLRIL